MDLKHLVSGTDIRGIVSEVEGKKVTLTEKEGVYEFCTCYWLSSSSDG